jgi:hypothetical protein
MCISFLTASLNFSFTGLPGSVVLDLNQGVYLKLCKSSIYMRTHMEREGGGGQSGDGFEQSRVS